MRARVVMVSFLKVGGFSSFGFGVGGGGLCLGGGGCLGSACLASLPTEPLGGFCFGAGFGVGFGSFLRCSRQGGGGLSLSGDGEGGLIGEGGPELYWYVLRLPLCVSSPLPLPHGLLSARG